MNEEKNPRQRRYSDNEIGTIKSLFGGENGESNLKLLRKVFLPKYDYEAPLGQTVDSLWMGLEQLSQMSPQDREVAILVQIRMNNHLEQQLLTLKFLANEKEETEEARLKRLKANSMR